MKTPRYLYTTGYEGMTSEAFIGRLQTEGVQTLMDVRELPLSRKAGFSKTTLSKLLADRCIACVHMPMLGCPEAVRDQCEGDSDWMRYTASFMDHLASQQPAVAALAKIGSATTAALMCFEADYAQCHRTCVARAVSQAEVPPVAYRWSAFNERQHWMEVYEPWDDTWGDTVDRCFAESGMKSLVDGARHLEVFVDLPLSGTIA